MEADSRHLPTFTRRLSLIALFLLAFVLAACDRGAEPVPSPFQTGEALTWDEWVAKESPKRTGFDPTYHYGLQLPDMSRWRPEDFLSKEILETEHADICSLPREERDILHEMFMRQADSREVFEKQLSWAKKGFPQAQGTLGWMCIPPYPFAEPFLEPGEFTQQDALAWARRGAASEDPHSMYRLAECMRAIVTHATPEQEASLSPFWIDEKIYWMQRAINEGLVPEALEDMREIVANVYDYAVPGELKEADIHRYTLVRLWELQALFRRYPRLFGPDYIESRVHVEQRRQELSESQFAQAEVVIAQWLRTYPEVWHKIYQRSPRWSWNRPSCHGEPDHHKNFDFETLNRELKQYGLYLQRPDEVGGEAVLRELDKGKSAN